MTATRSQQANAAMQLQGMQNATNNVGSGVVGNTVGIGGIGTYNPYAPQPAQRDPAGVDARSSFHVEKIANGYIVHLQRSSLASSERHFAENIMEVGKLVAATLVRWFIEAK